MPKAGRDHEREGKREPTGGSAAPVPTALNPVAGWLIGLQRSSGNRAVGALLGSRPGGGQPGPPAAAERPVGPPPAGPVGRQPATVQRATVAAPPGSVVQRDGPPPGGGQAPAPGLDQASVQVLAAAGLSVDDGDQRTLAQGFPQGITVGAAQPVILGMRFGQRLDGFRVTGFRITPAPAAVAPAVEAWLFQVGKGRAVLVSSIGGGSVLMDAGTGQTASVTAPSVQRLASAIGAVTAGPAQVPERIIVSHADTDHYNAVRAVLAQAGFSRTAVEIAQEQVTGAGGGAWAAMSLTVQPDQRLIQVNVAGAGGAVQVSRFVLDNMELTEFRSVTAHQDLLRTGRATYNRNRTSPVVVVRDLVSGQRMLFSADAQGRQFDEIVNAIGDQAMRRILGAEGHNLKLMEAPHHFGAQSGPDAAGMLNMLQLAYESGEGSMRLVAQTTQAFATRGSSTYTFLDDSGVAPDMVQGDPSPPGQAQATRARGSQLARVTLDLAGVQRALEVLQANDTTLRQAYGRLADLDRMRADTAAMGEALKGSGAPAPLSSSVAATDADLARLQTELRTSANQVWDQMRAAAGAAGGMRGSADLTQVTAALAALEARVRAQDADLTTATNDLEAQRAGLTLYERLASNAVKMIGALEADNVEELYRTRAEHTELVKLARGALGPAAVHEHVTAAWAAVRAEWTPERLEARTAELSARIASREMSADFRTLLAESLARQMQLNQIVAEAEHVGRTVYGPNGVAYMPASTRVGAGLMAAIEVVRIGLEVAAQYQQASQAASADAAGHARLGVATMNWWLRLNVTPTVALTERSSWSGDYHVVYESDQGLARQAATSDSRPAGVPEFDMVVVTGLDGSALRRLLHRAVVELATLEDWHAFNRGLPGGPAFSRFDSGWGVRLWSREDSGYRYVPIDGVEAGLGGELDRLEAELEKAQQAKMDQEVADTGGPDRLKSVKDTAWVIGTDRNVTVYDERGLPKTLNFGTTAPRLLAKGSTQWPVRLQGPLQLAKAADLETYRRLSAEWWVRRTGTEYADESGTHDELSLEPNSQGLAWVNPGDLVQAAP